jgi:hypothetical protein
MNSFATSEEYLKVDLDWEFDAETSDSENHLDYLADSTSLSIVEPIDRVGRGLEKTKETNAPKNTCVGNISSSNDNTQQPRSWHTMFGTTAGGTSTGSTGTTANAKVPPVIPKAKAVATNTNTKVNKNVSVAKAKAKAPPPVSPQSQASLKPKLKKDIENLKRVKQSPGNVRPLKTVSDTSSPDKSCHSTSGTSVESLDQAVHKEKCPTPVKRTSKHAVTTRRSGWKKPKDAPKRYLSAYNIFFSEERRRVYAESDEDIGFSGLGKIIGQRWSVLTDDQREPYEIMAEKDIGRYREEVKMYEDVRRRKYGRSLYRSPSSVTTASPISDDKCSPSPDRVSPAHHPVLESVMRQHQYAHHPPLPTVYAPQVIMPDQQHSGQYPNAGGQYDGQQQYPQVQYACVRMTRKKAQDYMHRYAGRQH